MKTKEELLNRICKIDEYNAIRGFEWIGHKNDLTNPDVLILRNFEESDNMCNFTLEFAALLKKYGVKIHGVNGMLVSFEFPDAQGKYLGVCPFWRWLQLTDEEMNAKIEEAIKEAEQKALNKEELVNEINEDELIFGCDNSCDTEIYDEDEEECELYDYDASGSFTADIEINVGKIRSLDVDEDLISRCVDDVYNLLDKDGVSIDSDYDELLENTKVKELEDGTTLVTISNAECSVRVDIQASCLDEANDERWSAFDSIICSLNYLKNIREEYVSEAD